MATKLEDFGEAVKKISKKIITFGEVCLTREEKQRYNTNFDDFCNNVTREIVEKEKEIINSRECNISFFPVGVNNLENLTRKTNATYENRNMISPLFYIDYDKNLEIKEHHKTNNYVPMKMRFMILV